MAKRYEFQVVLERSSKDEEIAVLVDVVANISNMALRDEQVVGCATTSSVSHASGKRRRLCMTGPPLTTFWLGALVPQSTGISALLSRTRTIKTLI